MEIFLAYVGKADGVGQVAERLNDHFPSGTCVAVVGGFLGKPVRHLYIANGSAPPRYLGSMLLPEIDDCLAEKVANSGVVIGNAQDIGLVGKALTDKGYSVRVLQH